MEKPKYKIGDSVVVRVSGVTCELVQITGGYLNTSESLKEWKYYTTHDRVVSVRESEIISLDKK